MLTKKKSELSKFSSGEVEQWIDQHQGKNTYTTGFLILRFSPPRAPNAHMWSSPSSPSSGGELGEDLGFLIKFVVFQTYFDDKLSGFHEMAYQVTIKS